MQSRVLYEERSGWAWWVHFLILLTLVAVVIPLVHLLKGKIGDAPDAMPAWAAILSASAGLLIPGGIYLLMGQLRTRVTGEGIQVRWGALEVIRKTIHFREVERADAVTYSPLGEFGGWGIRVGGRKKKAWNIRGNRAVLLHLRDGTRFYLGSEKPERILPWVHSGMKRRDE